MAERKRSATTPASVRYQVAEHHRVHIEGEEAPREGGAFVTADELGEGYEWMVQQGTLIEVDADGNPVTTGNVDVEQLQGADGDPLPGIDTPPDADSDADSVDSSKEV